jgi:hypothetical protein
MGTQPDDDEQSYARAELYGSYAWSIECWRTSSQPATLSYAWIQVFDD